MLHPIRKKIPEWLRRIRERHALERACAEFAGRIESSFARYFARQSAVTETAGKTAAPERPVVH